MQFLSFTKSPFTVRPSIWRPVLFGLALVSILQFNASNSDKLSYLFELQESIASSSNGIELVDSMDRYEIFYKELCRILLTLGLSPIIIMSIYSTFVLFGIFFASRKFFHRDQLAWATSLLSGIALTFPLFAHIYIRQGVVFSILLFTLGGSRVLSVLALFLSGFIHKSGFLLCPFAIAEVLGTRKRLTALLVASWFASFAVDTRSLIASLIVSLKLPGESYIASNVLSGSIPITSLFLIKSVIVAAFLIRKFNLENSDIRRLYFLYVCFTCLSVLSREIYILSSRLYMYVIGLEFVVLPAVISSLKAARYYKVALFAVALSISVVSAIFLIGP